MIATVTYNSWLLNIIICVEIDTLSRNQYIKISMSKVSLRNFDFKTSEIILPPPLITTHKVCSAMGSTHEKPFLG